MFAVYSLKKQKCQFVREVALAGILCKHIADTAKVMKPTKHDTMPWELSGVDLCRAAMMEQEIAEDGECCRVVSDTTYSRSDALIVEISHVWGFTYRDWTPILLRMSILFEDERPNGKKTTVECFQSCPEPGELIHEFLYLQKGHTTGTCTWGRTGMVNAALLYPDALAHLLGQIGFVQR